VKKGIVMKKVMFVLYVENQVKSSAFYRKVLNTDPFLDVPGMTEFDLVDGNQLGIMPLKGIKQLIGEALPERSPQNGVPHSEIYFIVEDANEYHQRALNAGAKLLSDLEERDWGQRVAYSLDPDGYVLAFAEMI